MSYMTALPSASAALIAAADPAALATWAESR